TATNAIKNLLAKTAGGAAKEVLPMAAYEAAHYPNQGETVAGNALSGAEMGAGFGAAGGALGSIAGGLSPVLASALKKVEAKTALSDAEKSAMAAYGYINPAVIGGGMGFTEPAQDWNERLQHMALGAGTFAASHALSQIPSARISDLWGAKPPEATVTTTATPTAGAAPIAPQPDDIIAALPTDGDKAAVQDTIDTLVKEGVKPDEAKAAALGWTPEDMQGMNPAQLSDVVEKEITKKPVEPLQATPEGAKVEPDQTIVAGEKGAGNEPQAASGLAEQLRQDVTGLKTEATTPDTLQSAITDIQGGKAYPKLTADQKAALKDAGLVQGKLAKVSEIKAIKDMKAEGDTSYDVKKQGEIQTVKLTDEEMAEIKSKIKSPETLALIESKRDSIEKEPARVTANYREAFLKEFGLGNKPQVEISTPIEKVTIKKSHYLKLATHSDKSRGEFINYIKPTLERPDDIRNVDGEHTYVKLFKNGEVKLHTTIVKVKPDGTFYVTNIPVSKMNKWQAKFLKGESILPDALKGSSPVTTALAELTKDTISASDVPRPTSGDVPSPEGNYMLPHSTEPVKPENEGALDQTKKDITAEQKRILGEGTKSEFVEGDVRKAHTPEEDEAALSKHGLIPDTVGEAVAVGSHKFNADNLTHTIKLSMMTPEEIRATSLHEIGHGIQKTLEAMGRKTDKALLEAAFKKEAKANGEAVSETIADKFRDYVLGKENAEPKGLVRRIFDRILEFGEKLKNYLNSRGFKSVNDIFGEAYEGKLAGGVAKRGSKDVKTYDGKNIGEQGAGPEVDYSIAGDIKDKVKDFLKSKDDEEKLRDKAAKEGFMPIGQKWRGNVDQSEYRNWVLTQNIQNDIKKLAGEKPTMFSPTGKYGDKSKEIDRALQLYVDMKRNPSDLAAYYSDFTDKQKAEVANMEKWQNNKQFQEIAKEIEKQYGSKADEALAEGIIKNKLPGGGYVNRQYADKPYAPDRTQHRKYNTIFEAWAKGGKELGVEGATNSLRNHHNEIDALIAKKHLIEDLKGAEFQPGQKLLSTTKEEGYKKAPNAMKTWVRAEGVKSENPEAGINETKDLRWDAKGNVEQLKPLYAPGPVADMLDNAFSRSKLKGIRGIDGITAFNAIAKRTILMSNLYHHQAFYREFATVSLSDPIKAMKDGNTAVMAMNKDVMNLVYHGLTLGRQRLEYEESFWNKDKGKIESLIDKAPIVSAVKDKMKGLYDAQSRWLFETFGQGLKVKAAMLTLERECKRRGIDVPDEQLYKDTAELMNNKFGGLNLEREFRNPTVQHLFRIFALAPDWTESNIRLMGKALMGGSQQEKSMYQRTWGNVIAKGVGATVVANLIMSAFDDKSYWERTKQAYDDGHLKVLDVNITPLTRLFGGNENDRKYFRLIGHYADPVKAVLNPLTFLKHKASPLFSMAQSALTGQDWKGQAFTSASELAGTDEKGVYLKNTKTHNAGEPKGGQLAGHLTKREGNKGPIGYGQIPSFLASSATGLMPVQLQALLNYATGEQDGIDTITKSLGIMESSTYNTPKKLGDEWTQRYLDAKKQGDAGAMAKVKSEVAKFNAKQEEKDEPTVNLTKLLMAAQKKERLAQQYKAAVGR
ncbi:MAG: hypothetical protein HQK98_10330, partial [Nitrospirae bacterium]|nr:hypothetical protein [Nitrospirota bacterium]